MPRSTAALPPIIALAVVLAAALALTLAWTARPSGAGATTDAAQSASAPHDDEQRPAVDHGHEPLQPAYVGGRVATYRFAPVDDGTDTRRARTLYEVEYPQGWEGQLARPLCDYCDHGGNGRDAYDFHDHVLDGLPNPRENQTGRVYWAVTHIAPAVTGEAAHDAAVQRAYADALPVTSRQAAQRLLDRELPDGSAVAAAEDTGFVFAGPITRFPQSGGR